MIIQLINFFTGLSTISINVLHPENLGIDKFVDEILIHAFKKISKPIIINNYYHHKQLIRFRSRQATAAYLFFVWGNDGFKYIFENNLLSNRRYLNLVFYIKKSTQRCETLNKEIENMLIRSWTHNRTHNVLINTPCHCSDEEFFFYDCFYFDGEWGRVRKIPLTHLREQIVKPFSGLQNLRGYPIKTSIFPREPTSIKYTTSPWYINENLSLTNFYGGFDGLLLVNMALYLNFTPVIQETKNGYGWKQSNGTYVGSLGDIIYRTADLSANSRFFEKFESRKIESTEYITTVHLCFIVPKSQRIPQWIQIFSCFSSYTWLLIVVTIAVISSVWILLQKTEAYMNEYKTSSAAHWSLCSAILFNFIDITPSFHGKILLATGMYFYLILTSIFQGNLATSFSIVSFYPEIDSLDALVNTDLKVSTNLDVLNDETSLLLKELNRKKANTFYDSSMDRAAYYRDVCTVERKTDAEFLIKTKYSDDDGVPLLHIISSCSFYKHLTYIVPSESPFLSAFNNALQKFREAGLTEKWYSNSIDFHFIQEVYKSKKRHTSTGSSPIDIYDIQSAFYILFTGLVTALFMFIGEIYIFWLRS